MGWPFDGKIPHNMARARSTQWIIFSSFILFLCIQRLNADDRETTGTLLLLFSYFILLCLTSSIFVLQRLLNLQKYFSFAVSYVLTLQILTSLIEIKGREKKFFLSLIKKLNNESLFFISAASFIFKIMVK
jgi:hypothetical protein